MLKGMVTRSTANTFELSNNVDVTMAPAIIIQWGYSIAESMGASAYFIFFLSRRKKSGTSSGSSSSGKSVSGSGILYDLHSRRAHFTA